MRKCSINKNLNFKAKILGVEFETNSCGKCRVVEYTNAKDLVVEFEEYPCRVRCTLSHLRLREVSNPMYPSCYGVGYIGVGEFRPTKNNVAYKIWMGVLDRCYGRKERYPAYEDVTVCEEWLNFQNFAEWFYFQEHSQSKDHNGRLYNLDKDILVKGSRIYSPETCCFVPNEVNTCINRKNRGLTNVRQMSKFRWSSRINRFGKEKHLGSFETKLEDFVAYKEAKSAYVAEVAEKWRGKIDDKVYQALLEWKIEITD